MTNIGKPYEGKPHVRFDEEGLGSAQPFTLVKSSLDIPGFAHQHETAHFVRLDEYINQELGAYHCYDFQRFVGN